MVEENFSKACNEVLQVLQNINIEEYNKIPKEFIKFLKENADYNYKSKINYNKEFNEQELLPETIDLLAYIYRKYWCKEQEKFIFDKEMCQNERKYQDELRNQYSYNNIFEKNDNKLYVEKKDNTNLPVEHKERMIVKFFRFLKNLIRIH